MKKTACLIIVAVILLLSGGVYGAQETIELSPSAPYERFIIYQNLVIFWIAIIGLVVIIKLKLREIERTQKLGIDREEKDIPLLD
jgi:TRAP-type C4-dicarboxylate transport system permease small subunit